MMGGIPIEIYMDLLYRRGYREQLKLDQDFPPVIYIAREKLTSVPMGYSFNGTGWIHSEDHPAFAELRERLDKEGYIEIQRSWSNGDRVLKPFYLNNMYFDVGEQFSCAAALGGQYDIAMRKNASDPKYGGLSTKPLRPEEDTGSVEEYPYPGFCTSQTLPLAYAS